MANKVEIIKKGNKEYEITSDVEDSGHTYVSSMVHNNLHLLCIEQDGDDIRLTKAEVEALITVLTEYKEQM